ncbi:MAG: hypothetical protein IKF64_06285 [Eubacterium sp.]|nr:hypothetical protein [Eubacterium sp.]
MKIKKLSKKQVIAIIVVAVILLVTVPTGIFCTVKKESPIEMVTNIFTDEDELISKWQGEKAVSAYEFKEDGTYESFISTFSYTGTYVVSGNKLTLTNPGSEGRVVYKYNVTNGGKELHLTLIEENGQKKTESDELVFKKVDHINTKSFTDILTDFAKEQASQKEENEEASTEKADETTEAEEDTTEETSESVEETEE